MKRIQFLLISLLLGGIFVPFSGLHAVDTNGLCCGIEVQSIVQFGEKFHLKVWLENDGSSQKSVDLSRLKCLVRCVQPSRRSENSELYSSILGRENDVGVKKSAIVLQKGEGFFKKYKIDVPESGLYSISISFDMPNGRRIVENKEVKVEEGPNAIRNALKILDSDADPFDRIYAIRCINLMADNTVNRELFKRLNSESEQAVQIVLCEVLMARLFQNEVHSSVRLGVDESVESYEKRANRWVSDAKNRIKTFYTASDVKR